MPLAPGRLSTTKFWPKVVVKCCATVRAITSDTPPALAGLMMRTVLAGHSWAWAQVSVAVKIIPSAASIFIWRSCVIALCCKLIPCP